MHSRFLTNSALSILGAFVVVASMSWHALTFEWLMFGGGIAAVVLAGAIALPRRGLMQRGMDGAIALLGAWTIVASQAFSGLTVTWIGFGAGIAMFALALGGLSMHEARSERVVHAIEVHTQVPEPKFTRTSDQEFAGIANG